MEFDLHDDPASYDARPIFGTFDKRGITTLAVIVVLILPIIVLSFVNEWPVELVSLACAAIAVPVGLAGMGKIHGLYAERWVPLVLRERKAPREMIWLVPSVVIEGLPPKSEPTRAERRAERREARADKRERAREDVEDVQLLLNFTAVRPDGGE